MNTAISNGNPSFRVHFCPLCQLDGRFNTLKKYERISEDYIGESRECEQCGYWEAIE